MKIQRTSAHIVYEHYKRNYHRLTPRERLVITSFYGFGKTFRHSLNEIAVLIGGVSRERVRQLKERALRKIEVEP